MKSHFFLDQDCGKKLCWPMKMCLAKARLSCKGEKKAKCHTNMYFPEAGLLPKPACVAEDNEDYKQVHGLPGGKDLKYWPGLYVPSFQHLDDQDYYDDSFPSLKAS